MSCSGPTGGRVLRRILGRGSEKGLPEGTRKAETYPFAEYDPSGVRPLKGEGGGGGDVTKSNALKRWAP